MTHYASIAQTIAGFMRMSTVIVTKIDKPAKRIKQSGVITVSPTDQPEIAENWAREHVDNPDSSSFPIFRQHRIELFQTI